MWSFVFLFLRDQFKYFFNFFFLVIGFSQLVPLLRVDNTFTYFAPLTAVLSVTMIKEAYADYRRYCRDREANSQTFERLIGGGSTVRVPSSSIRVGDVLRLEKGQRVPADIVLLRSADKTGSVFIKTDQLDGETDWKLRVAVAPFQKLSTDEEVFAFDAEVFADAPIKDIYSFIGTLRISSAPGAPHETVPLTVEHTLWMNTVVASGSVIGVVVYTGKDSRAIMNTSVPKSKSSLIEKELSRITLLLCVIATTLSLALALCRSNHTLWYIYCFRFIILFSYIIPVSLRINVDIARTLYNRWIEGDRKIQDTCVRTGNVCEELGRIGYLLSDKTGTLTKNEMEMKKVHMGTVSYDSDSLGELSTNLKLAFSKMKLKTAANSMQLELNDAAPHQSSPHASKKNSLTNGNSAVAFGTPAARGKRDIHFRIFDLVQALVVCHNVTPVHERGETTYQASSPDEIAIVKWTNHIGMSLDYRDRECIRVVTVFGDTLSYEILHMFPFTSESKRMGIIVRDKQTNEIVFYQKGADVIMTTIVAKNDWLDEECGNMAREGLRTLVVGRKKLTEADYVAFEKEYHEARISIADRSENMQLVVANYLERDLELLGLTGVEDKLQEDVNTTLEALSQAGIKVWMLTGDKVETATCIALSSKLIKRGQPIFTLQKIINPESVTDIIKDLSHRSSSCMVIDGTSLQTIIDCNPQEFVLHASKMSAVVCCRCSPTQKAVVAELLKKYTKKVVCCIGDGGNDVSMIQAANVGIGIVGKEGKQASLASDVSVMQFSHILRLFLWHGRTCYKRTANVAQFVIHRGVILTVMQAVFSSIFYVAPIALYKGFLTVGYSTIFTMFPVFSLVLDHDVTSDIAILYPILYKELVKGRCLSMKTFFVWLWKSVYQGGVIMLCTLCLFEYELLHMSAITYSALILNELIMVALEVHTWHILMLVAEFFSLMCFFGSLSVFQEQFNFDYQDPKAFVLKMLFISSVSFLPFVLFKIFQRILVPPSYSKLK